MAGPRGVVRLTVYDASANTLPPLAERLVYRVPAEQLHLSVKGLKKIYRKGERANLEFQAADEQGRKTIAWYGAAVVDERALVPADLETPSPQAHFFLLSEVRRPEDLEQADLLLADSPEARKALDMFLGTQGWRRFVPANAAPGELALYARNKDDKASAEVLFSRENNSPAGLAALHDARLKEALDQLGQETARSQQALAQEKEQRIEDARLAAIELAQFQNLPAAILRLSAGFLVLALLVAGVLLLVWGLVRLQRGSGPSTIAFAGSCCSFLVCLILYGAAGLLPASRTNENQHLSWLLRQAWPMPENFQAAKTVPPAGVPSGAFALAPAILEEKSAPPVSTSVRATSRNMSQLAGAGDRGSPGGVVLSEPQFKDRFLQAKTFQDKLAKAGKTNESKESPHPAIPAGKGGGAKAKKDLTYAELAREYPFIHKNHGRGLDAAATVLWHPNLFAADGSARVSFDLSSSPATYRIILLGNTPSGRLGSYQSRRAGSVSDRRNPAEPLRSLTLPARLAMV